VSRNYVNNVNITNTSVNVTRVTNVYNSVIVNKSTTINNITYVNQHVNNGVTVVSHDTFVNARPVAQNVMKVEPREIAAAPISHVVVAEPVRSSVIGAGRPVSVRPPAAVISRPVVAVQTPPPLPRSIEQRQTEAGGHLNQQLLVRPAGPTRPAPVNQAPMNQGQPTNQGQPSEGFKPFRQPGGINSVNVQPNAQPRVYENQGTPPPPENRPENRNVPQPQYRNVPQPEERPSQSSNQETHPLVKPTPPVQERTPQQEQQQAQKFNQWQQQRPAPPPPPQPHPSQPKPEPSKPPKKGH